MFKNFLRHATVRSMRDLSFCLVLIHGPAKCPKQWFHQDAKNKCFIQSNQKHYSTFHRDKLLHNAKYLRTFLFSNLKWPRFLVLPIFGYILSNYEYCMKELVNIFPKVKGEGVTQADLDGRRSKYNFIGDVAEISAPAVVYIEIWNTKKYDYYTGQPIAISNGSGFIIESDGLIMTNAHVVIDNAVGSNIAVMVKCLDGKSFEGKVESVDRISDLATVRIKCQGLPILRLGHSGSLNAGEWVVALGSPLALSNTVTCGIISAYRRSEELGLHRQKIVYLQTDASINQGNSGGPLMNLEGEVIGINSMKILPGISFAIPIDHAKDFLRSSRDKRFNQRSTRKSYIGVSMVTLSEAMIIELRQRKCSLSNKVRDGVMFWKILPDSPGARAFKK